MDNLVNDLAIEIIKGCDKGINPVSQRDLIQDILGREVAIAAGERAQYLVKHQWDSVEKI